MSSSRSLASLVSVGPATLHDFEVLGVRTVDELAQCEARELYERLCKRVGVRLDPCCEDVFAAAIAQAKDPALPAEQKKWWYWSRKRKQRAQRNA
jgi:nucleotidyltransferase/DNA polymerase involved in DNA repair